MKNQNTSLAGYLLITISAVTFSAKGIFAKVLYSYGIDPVTLLALRFAIALPFFWGLLFIYQSERVGKKDLILIILSGLVGFYFSALADFYGLLYIDASLERTIIYSFPTMVVILTAILFKERIDGRKLSALMLTYGGLVLALKVFNGNLNGHLLGAGLVLFSAFVGALSYILTEALSKRVSSLKISTYSITACAFAFIGTWHGTHIPHDMKVWEILLFLAIISTFIPVVTLAMGIKRIGASRAAIVSSIGPVSTAILAYIFLGEQMDFIQVIGMILVMAGVLVISYKENKVQAEEI
ncbi:MAG: DMT family transporter [Deltaproteobacteria bacterium]|nr:DMT family transporter [Deltaproteobacteria bacterium]